MNAHIQKYIFMASAQKMEIFPSVKKRFAVLFRNTTANQYKESSNQNLLQMVPLSVVNYIIFIYKVTYKWVISWFDLFYQRSTCPNVISCTKQLKERHCSQLNAVF
jgi:hypothetical protein